MNDLQYRFEQFIKEHHLLRRGQSVLLAVSGGVDSMAMMSLFIDLAPSWQLTLAVGHVNHGLRGTESDGDEQFVRATAESHAIPFYSTRVETKRVARETGRSKQEAARAVRYEFLDSVRRRIGADVIATAHQANDNAETVLFNALRGAGVRGLSGIPVIRRDIPTIRPLLFATREAIEPFAHERNIAYRLDSSNLSTAYTRNFLRRTVLPELQRTFDPFIIQSLNRVAAVMGEYSRELEDRAQHRLSAIAGRERGLTAVSVSGFKSAPENVQGEMVLELIRSRARRRRRKICAGLYVPSGSAW